jgi:hypothetical protein
MRRTTRFILTVLAVLGVRAGFAAEPPLPCSPPKSDQLVALWESVGRSKGGIGHTLEFRSDGTFVEAVTVLVDMYYHASGGRVVIDEKPIAGTGDANQSMPFRIEGGTLIQEDARKERIGALESAVQATIVGAWRYRHYTGAMAFEQYTPEGRLYFRLPMTSSVGCYQVDGAKLTLADQKETRGSFDLRIDDLVLHFPGKEPVKYYRDPAGPWYERERIDIQLPREKKR